MSERPPEEMDWRAEDPLEIETVELGAEPLEPEQDDFDIECDLDECEHGVGFDETCEACDEMDDDEGAW